MYTVANKPYVIDGEIVYYIMNEANIEVAWMRIRDSKGYKGYSLVPCITLLHGSEEGMLMLLNWFIGKLKGPFLADFKYPILRDYGFEDYGRYLLWKPEGSDVRVVQQQPIRWKEAN